MPSVVEDLTKDWSAQRSGPLEVAIQAVDKTVVYFLSSTLPTGSSTGHILDPGVGHTVNITLGDNLYARARSSDSARLTITE